MGYIFGNIAQLAEFLIGQSESEGNTVSPSDAGHDFFEFSHDLTQSNSNGRETDFDIPQLISLLKRSVR